MKLLTILAHAFVGWTVCAATIGIGMATVSPHTALIVHAIVAPIAFTLVSSVYFTRFTYTTPLETAVLFVGFVIAMDIVVVALLILRSLAMFASPLGTWIPFALIFTATYVTGFAIVGRPHRGTAAH
jgi:hypothetical protein